MARKTILGQSVLDMPIKGRNLKADTLGGHLGEQPTLLVFLRHFGCIFCREMVADLRKLAEARADYPAVLFFHQNDVAEGDHHFKQFWAEAAVVADPSREFYKTFGVQNGGLGSLMNPDVVACGVRAASKGHMQGVPTANTRSMPTLYLVRDGEVLWMHKGDHAGDHPDFSQIPSRIPQMA